MEDYALKRKISVLSGDEQKPMEVSILHFDLDSLSPIDYRQALGIEARLRGEKFRLDISLGKRTSSEFRIAVAWIAAVRGTKGLCIDDIDRIHILDLLELETRGLLFFGESV